MSIRTATGEGYIPVHLEVRRGDLFLDRESQVFAHCVSRDFAMGAGIALKFKEYYSNAIELASKMLPVGKTAFLNTRKKKAVRESSPFAVPQFVGYMITKKFFYDKPTMEDLEKALRDLKHHMGVHSMTRLAIPRIGCGLDKLKWPSVKALIKRVMSEHDPRFQGLGPIYVTVWVHKGD